MNTTKQSPPLVVIPIFITYVVLVIAAIVSITRKPLSWGKKWMWLPVLLIQPIGPIIYFVKGSGMLESKIRDNLEQVS